MPLEKRGKMKQITPNKKEDKNEQKNKQKGSNVAAKKRQGKTAQTAKINFFQSPILFNQWKQKSKAGF